MRRSEFDYHLPLELIAQQPLADRSGSRMLCLDREHGGLADRHFREFPGLLKAGDLVVVNDTRVIPARLFGHRSGARSQPISPRNPAHRNFLAGKVEVLLTRRLSDTEWQVLVRPGRKIGVGERLTFGDGELEADVTARGEFGERTLRFAPKPSADIMGVIERLGHIPLPPYIDRPDEPGDRERYQTVFSRQSGSAAAPTAGLHFTSAVLDELRGNGVEISQVTLHVGLGTFQPLREETVEANRLHAETYAIPAGTAAAITRAKAEGRRVIAVGTTTVRTLEHAASATAGGAICPGSGETTLFIFPGFKFRVVDAMLTNFHLPQSSLLMLVCAFAGTDRVLTAYRHAVEQRYRFFSYGDCMFIE